MVAANGSSCCERKSTEEVKKSQTQLKNTHIFTCDSHQKGSKKRLSNNANTKITHSKAAEQTFCRRMNRRHFVECNEDKSVAERCSESKKNIESKNEWKEWSSFNDP